MTKNPYGFLYRLAEGDVLTPVLEAAMLNDKWPDSYQITVDSTPYEGNGDQWFHPSSHALKGERWLYYNMHPDYKDKKILERRSLTSAMTLAMGSALHAVVQTQLLVAGLLTEDDIEVRAVDSERRYRGHADFVITVDGIKRVVDLKTQNSRSFALQKEPKPEWVAQVNLYMEALGIDEGMILVLESGFPYQFKEFRFKKDPELLREIFDKWERVLEAVANDTPPRPCCAFGSPEMSSCPFRQVCWLSDDPKERP